MVAHLHVHAAAEAAHHWERPSEEIIVIIEEIGKWVLSAKEVSKYVISHTHIEVSMLETTSSKIAEVTTIISSASTAYATLLEEVPAVRVIIFSLLGIA